MNFDVPVVDFVVDVLVVDFVVDVLVMNLDSMAAVAQEAVVVLVVVAQRAVVDKMSVVEVVAGVVEMVLTVVDHELQEHHSMLQSFDL
jgi:hypothetical protein